MKKINLTHAAIWVILFITAKLYVFDLPIVFKTMANIERSKMKTDSIQTLKIGELIDANNKVVDVLNSILKTKEE